MEGTDGVSGLGVRDSGGEERQQENVRGQKDGNGSGLQTARAQTAGTPAPAAVCKQTAGTRTEQGGSGTTTGEIMTDEDLAMYRVTREDIENPVPAMFSGGIMKAHRVAQAVTFMDWRHKGEEVERLTKLLTHGREGISAIEIDDAQRRLNALKWERGVRDAVPLWQQLTGLRDNAETAYPPNERLGRLVRFLTGVKKIVRFEVRAQLNHRGTETQRNTENGTNERQEAGGGRLEERQKDDGGGNRNSKIKNQNSDGEWDAEVAEARSYRWEPLREICREFGIAQRKLSTFCHEALGMSASEMVDAVKAETVRGRMKRDLREWMIQVTTETQRHRGTQRTEEGEGKERSVKERAVEVFEALKKWRRNRWHRATWAMEHGFSSYQRMFRGCLHAYRMTPHELELAVIAEILREGERTDLPQRPQSTQRTEGDRVSGLGVRVSGNGDGDGVLSPES